MMGGKSNRQKGSFLTGERNPIGLLYDSELDRIYPSCTVDEDCKDATERGADYSMQCTPQKIRGGDGETANKCRYLDTEGRVINNQE